MGADTHGETNECKGQYINDCPYPSCQCAQKVLRNEKLDEIRDRTPHHIKEQVDTVVELIDEVIKGYQLRLEMAFLKASSKKALSFTLGEIEEIIKNTK